MRESPPPSGRTIVTLLTMLGTFVVLGVILVALDTATGVHVPSLLSAATIHPTATSAASPSPSASPVASAASSATPTPTTRPGGAASSSATAAASATTGPTVSVPRQTPTPIVTAPTDTATALPSPTSSAQPTATATVAANGSTPPHYGALYGYANNTAFTPSLLQSTVERIITLTNQQRAARGLKPLVESGALDIIAASRSEDLVMRNYFDHYDPTGPVDASGHHAPAVQELLARNNIPYTEVGENLIGNSGYPLDAGTPAQVVDAWMHHKEHRDNILHPSYTTIGVGVAAQNRPDGLRVVITQVFLR